MSSLNLLRKQLNGANVTDDMIARGVRLTSTGMAKLSRKFNCSSDDLKQMLIDLSRQVKDEIRSPGLPESPDFITEANERFTYEADVMGNVTLRDTKTGATRFLQGTDGTNILHEIEINHPNYQGVIAPYFNDSLLEFASGDVATDDVGNTGGTYNFPFQGNFACARFWLSNHKPRVEVVSVVDANGEDIHLDDSTLAAANKAAWEWVDKV